MAEPRRPALPEPRPRACARAGKPRTRRWPSHSAHQRRSPPTRRRTRRPSYHATPRSTRARRRRLLRGRRCVPYSFLRHHFPAAVHFDRAERGRPLLRRGPVGVAAARGPPRGTLQVSCHARDAALSAPLLTSALTGASGPHVAGVIRCPRDHRRASLPGASAGGRTTRPNPLPADRRRTDPPQNQARCGTHLRYSPPRPSATRIPIRPQNRPICRPFAVWSQPGSNR